MGFTDLQPTIHGLKEKDHRWEFDEKTVVKFFYRIHLQRKSSALIADVA